MAMAFAKLPVGLEPINKTYHYAYTVIYQRCLSPLGLLVSAAEYTQTPYLLLSAWRMANMLKHPPIFKLCVPLNVAPRNLSRIISICSLVYGKQ